MAYLDQHKVIVEGPVVVQVVDDDFGDIEPLLKTFLLV
jgi:hypothetical protein